MIDLSTSVSSVASLWPTEQYNEDDACVDGPSPMDRLRSVRMR